MVITMTRHKAAFVALASIKLSGNINSKYMMVMATTH